MICDGCNTELSPESKFCRYCGASQVAPQAGESVKKEVLMICGLFYSINLILCIIINYVDSLNELRYYILFDLIITTVTIVLIAFTFTDIKSWLRWDSFCIKKLLLYVLAALLFSLLVQFLVTILNKKLFDKETYYYFSFIGTKYPIFFMILMIAVQPAIIEELGFRGLLISQLNKIIDRDQVIFISAFLFALIHLSIFSMLWLMPFAMFLAYLRQKENTIWYGVVVHFVFNATACFVEVYNLDLFI